MHTRRTLFTFYGSEQNGFSNHLPDTNCNFLSTPVFFFFLNFIFLVIVCALCKTSLDRVFDVNSNHMHTHTHIQPTLKHQGSTINGLCHNLCQAPPPITVSHKHTQTHTNTHTPSSISHGSEKPLQKNNGAVAALQHVCVFMCVRLCF